jgi:tetratricopeptide (TPR) repeat protein
LKSSLAGTLSFEDRYAEADRMLRETLKAQREVLGAEHPDTLNTMLHLGDVLDMEAKFPEALALKQSAFDVQRRILGPEDEQTIVTMYWLGDTLRDMGRYAEAETLYRELLDAQRRILGPEHPHTLTAMDVSRSFSAMSANMPRQRRYTAKFWMNNAGCWDRNTLTRRILVGFEPRWNLPDRSRTQMLRRTAYIG